MWNEILNDLWRVYRGRLLGSVFGLFIGAMFFNFWVFFANYIFTDLYFRQDFFDRQQNR